MPNRTRRLLASVALALALLSTTAACGDDGSDGSGDSGDSGDSGSSTSGPKVIEVTIKGDDVTPNGERVEVSVGQEVELDVTADAPGEIHVHSTPEQELEYDQGETKLTIKDLDAPGTVDVESHALEKVIVQLQVS